MIRPDSPADQATLARGTRRSRMGGSIPPLRATTHPILGARLPTSEISMPRGARVESTSMRPAHGAWAAQRRGEPGELAQEGTGVAGIDDLLDAERAGGAERRPDGVHLLVDLGPQPIGIR